MFSYEIYKIVHLTSLILVFSGISVLLTLKATGTPIDGSSKKIAFYFHGFGLLFILISGFGLLARLGLVKTIPNWIYVKFAVWLVVGASLTAVKQLGSKLKWWLFLIFILFFVTAASMAILKPF